jgi:predicted house-cleaning NTP pyrophosphatase (Maf/HAM1 superfamily)
MNQKARNACGTIAAMHSILNCDESLITKDSVFGKFLESTKGMTPD